MIIFIPCAGKGSRFEAAGYAMPKPLIPINGLRSRRKIIGHVLDMCGPQDEINLICTDVDLAQIKSALDYPRHINHWFHAIKPHDKGPVFSIDSVINKLDILSDHEQVMVIYCDGTAQLDRPAFESFVQNEHLDGCLITHTGFHPHTLSGTKMAYLKTDGQIVTEIQEKAAYTDNCMAEHASSGMYYFRLGKHVKKYFRQLLETTPGHGGEFYVTLVYNLMIKDGLKVGFYDTDHVAILGTPETVQNFEAWATIIRGDQVRNEEDLLKCYRYWCQYHRFSKSCQIHGLKP